MMCALLLSREGRASIARDHHSRAGAVELRQITSFSHTNLQLRSITADDRAIGIGFVEREMEHSSSSAATMACVAKLARLTCRWQGSRGGKGRRFDDLFADRKQVGERAS
jgi:hypothetical protein